MIIRKLDKFQSFHQDAAAHSSRQTSLRSITDRLIIHPLIGSFFGYWRESETNSRLHPLTVANVGLLVVFFGLHDLLTSFARFLIGDVAVLEASAQNLVDDGDQVKLEEPRQGIASSAARKVGFSLFWDAAPDDRQSLATIVP